MGSVTVMLWHYTTGNAFADIMADRVLKTTSPPYLTKYTRPELWFSSAKYWEQSASCFPALRRKWQTNMLLTAQQCNGLYRFSLDTDRSDIPKFYRWRELGSMGVLPIELMANHTLLHWRSWREYRRWYCCFKSISINKCNSIQQWTPPGCHGFAKRGKWIALYRGR